LVSHMVDGGISILKYVDDTILFIYGSWFSEGSKNEVDFEFFEQLSGLKISFEEWFFW
jgi:hypothetical protein